MNDEKIMELYSKRSEYAIKKLSKKYRKSCWRLSYNIIRDKHYVGECVDNAFHDIRKSIQSISANELSIFLYRTVRNLSIKIYESLPVTKRKKIITETLKELEDCISNKSNEGLQYSNEQLSSYINRFLGSLNAEKRIIFVRKYWYFDSLKSIITHCNMKKSKVELLLIQTRDELREFIKNKGISLNKKDMIYMIGIIKDTYLQEAEIRVEKRKLTYRMAISIFLCICVGVLLLKIDSIFYNTANSYKYWDAKDLGTLPGASTVYPVVMYEGKEYEWFGTSGVNEKHPKGVLPKGYNYVGDIEYTDSGRVNKDFQFTATFKASGKLYFNKENPNIVCVRIKTSWIKDGYVLFRYQSNNEN